MTQSIQDKIEKEFCQSFCHAAKNWEWETDYEIALMLFKHLKSQGFVISKRMNDD